MSRDDSYDMVLLPLQHDNNDSRLARQRRTRRRHPSTAEEEHSGRPRHPPRRRRRRQGNRGHAGGGTLSAVEPERVDDAGAPPGDMSGVVLAPETTMSVASPQRASPKRADDASTLAKDLLGVSLVPEMTVRSVPDATSPPSIDQEGPVKHTIEECVMLRRYFHMAGPPAEDGKGQGNNKKEGDKEEEFPEVHNCFMIYGEQVVNPSARHRKQERREVCSVKVAAPVYLDWSDKPITFDRGDHPDFVPSPGRYPLVVDPIIGNVRLSKVLMDGGSSLNIICAETLELLGVDRSEVRAGAAPFHGIAPEKRILPLGQIDLLVCFGTPSNFRKETLTFEVVGFRGTYHAVLGRPCYAKFMAVPNYTYLKLKMPGPNGTITIGSTYRHAYECDVECMEYAEALAESKALITDLECLSKEAPDAKRHAGNFEPAEAVKSVPLDPSNDASKKVRIGSKLDPK
jgi:hypothetical protein